MRKLLLILVVLTSFSANAQRTPVWGYLRDSVTNEPITLASVTNLNTGKTVMTSNTGRFSIEASQYHILSFAAVGYFFDTVHYSADKLLNDTLICTLSPLARDLGNVTVTAKGYNRYQLDSMERRKDFMQGTADYVKPTFALANSGAGIGLSLDRFSRHEKNKRKTFAFFETNEKEAYINYRFPASIVTEYSGLKDEALQNFMQQYRPTAEWLRKHLTEEDIKYYINDKLKQFFKRSK